MALPAACQPPVENGIYKVLIQYYYRVIKLFRRMGLLDNLISKYIIIIITEIYLIQFLTKIYLFFSLIK